MPSKCPLYILGFSLFLLSGLLFGCGQKPVSAPSETPTSSSIHQERSTVEFSSADLGFSFSLPPGWEGFRVQHAEWEGLKSGDLGDEVVQQGLLISIIHPGSSAQQPRQDIPIMVFTIDQWSQLQEGGWHIGAAPIGPLELGRNSRYVFALPARYNYAFLEGWEEVEKIVQSHPMVTFEPGVFP